MDFALPPDVEELRAVVRQFVDRDVLPIEGQIDRENRVPPPIIERAASLGLFKARYRPALAAGKALAAYERHRRRRPHRPRRRHRRPLTAFVVESGFKGFRVARVQDAIGLRGSHIAEFVFEDCEVPAENILGEPGQGLARRSPRWPRGASGWPRAAPAPWSVCATCRSPAPASACSSGGGD